MPRTIKEVDHDLGEAKRSLQDLKELSARLEERLDWILDGIDLRVTPLKERLDRVEPEFSKLREDHARLETEFRELKRTLEEDRKQRRALWITLFVVFITASVGLGKDWIGAAINGARRP